MAFDNTNRGVLFQNSRKTTESHPDYSGSVNVDGVEYFFDGWIKVAGPNAQKPGSKFLSVSVKKKDSARTAAPAPAPRPAPRPGPSFDDMDDDIPFSYGVA